MGALFRLQQVPDLQRLGEAVDPLAWGVELPAVGLVLALQPARADAEIDPAAGHVVDRDRLLEQEGRVAVGVAADHHAQADALRDGREPGQDRLGLVGGVHHVFEAVEVVDDVEAVEAEGLGFLGAAPSGPARLPAVPEPG